MPNRAARIGDVVAIEWLDAWMDVGESNERMWNATCPIITYGVLKRKGDIVTVASEVLTDSYFRAVTHIPADLVVHITVLT